MNRPALVHVQKNRFRWWISRSKSAKNDL